jgi:outer membrane immunogenic protein
MKKLTWSAAFAAVVLVAGPAMAADMPVKAPAPAVVGYDWTGFYIGVNAGYSWGRAKWDNCVTGSGYFAQSSRDSICSAGHGRDDSDNFTGGGQIGYLGMGGPLPFIGGRYVFGFEADFQYFKVDPSRSISITYPDFAPTGYSLTQSASTDWLATFRYRSGVAYNNLLLYTTYGLAVTELKSSFSFRDDFPVAGTISHTASGSRSDVWLGWAAGGGAEWGITRNWTLRAEYLYVQFKGMDFTSNNLVSTAGVTFPNETFIQKTELRAHIARAAINYRF